MNSIEKAFSKMKAKVQIKEGPRDTERRAFRSNRIIRSRVTPDGYTVNVRNGKFVFDLGGSNAKIAVQDADAKDRHVLVNVQTEAPNPKGGGVTITNEKWLCGHDERDWFVAAVKSEVINIWEAKQSLKPDIVKSKEVGVKRKEIQKRKNEVFKRQGEWFFIPAEPALIPDTPVIHKDEPMSRGGGSKPHIVEECFRTGGTTVYVGRGKVLSESEYNQLPIEVKNNFQARQANASVFVRGYVKHPDHETIYLDGWHHIIMNEEARKRALLFLD